MHPRTLSAALVLSVIAVPVTAISKTLSHPAHVLEFRSSSAPETVKVLARPLPQTATSFKPVIAQAVYRPASSTNDVAFADGADNSDQGRGIWMQIAAGCGLLAFGAFRRLAAF